MLDEDAGNPASSTDGETATTKVQHANEDSNMSQESSNQGTCYSYFKFHENSFNSSKYSTCLNQL